MNFWAIVFVPLIVNIFLAVIDVGKRTNKHVVQASRGVRIMGWISSLGATVTSLIFYFSKYSGRAWAIVFGLAVLALLFLVISLSLHIDYSKDGFSVRCFLGKPKKYTYEQIDGVILGTGGSFKLIVNGKKLFIDSIMEGNSDFLAHMHNRYIRTCGKELPIIKDSLFHGFILNPGEILLVYALIPVMITALSIFIIIRGADDSCIPDKLETINFSVLDYRILNRVSVEMKTTAGIAYFPKGVINNEEKLFQKFDDKARFSALAYLRYISKDGQKEYDIWHLSDEAGNVFADEESISKKKKELFIRSVFIIILVLLVAWALFAGCIYILNHAPDHPILMRVLVKKSDWNF